jgi:predicted dehydrogenase
MNRRKFIRTGSAAAGLTILPTGVITGKNAPSNKLNIAMIGVWGRAPGHFGIMKKENVVALCDVDENHFTQAAKLFPNAKRYADWRKCLEQKDIDAVVICTTDHTHAFIANWALNRGMHVYCEKPMAITVEEARTLRSKWMGMKGKIATQVGTQRHAMPNFNRVRELVLGGAVGDLQAAYAWGNRKVRSKGYLPAAGSPPKNLNWDLWLGPAPEHPYNPGYFKGSNGMNCLSWNLYWDFGLAQVGDMGSHTMDLLWNAVDATLPTSAQAKGEAFNPDVIPVKCEMQFEHPANDWRGPIRVSWHQGGAMPRSPSKWLDLNKISHGVMFKGSKGFIVTDFGSRMIIPFGNNADFTYYKPRTPDTVIADLGNFQNDWLQSCKDPSRKTACDFEYSANLIEQQILGLVAYRAGKKIEYDPKAGRVTNDDAANALLSRKYRKGWTLEG